jgi:hypothetical protein
LSHQYTAPLIFDKCLDNGMAEGTHAISTEANNNFQRLWGLHLEGGENSLKKTKHTLKLQDYSEQSPWPSKTSASSYWTTFKPYSTIIGGKEQLFERRLSFAYLKVLVKRFSQNKGAVYPQSWIQVASRRLLGF